MLTNKPLSYLSDICHSNGNSAYTNKTQFEYSEYLIYVCRVKVISCPLIQESQVFDLKSRFIS